MTWRWVIFFSALPLFSADVSGHVNLLHSHVAAVRKKLDYSGVVISLKPVGDVAAVSRPAVPLARMVQKNKTFMPHVLAIQVGASIEFPNLDPIFHSAFSNYNGQLFDLALYPPGSTRTVRFRREGIVRVFCNIHSSMSAVIVVLGTPYFATTRRDGSFEIPNVPPGEYRLDVFHERATEATLEALERRVTVGNAPLELPMMTISEAGFLTIPHKNKYGRDYPAQPDDHSIYPAVRN